MINHPNRGKSKSEEIAINGEIARKLLETVDAGLCKGLGDPEPGKMCVEAAVCYAMGLPHSDNPVCVAPALRSLQIKLNDAAWSSKVARAKGMRRLALAQLGSADALDEKEFVRRLVDLSLRKMTPRALRAAAAVLKDEKHKAALCEAANRCEKEGTREAALDAKKAANAAYAAAYAAANAAYAAANAAYAAANAAYAAAYAAADAAYAAADAADAAAYAAYAAADAADAAAYAADAAAYGAYAAANAAADAANAAAYAADAAAYGAYAAAKKARAETRDRELSEYAEDVVQILADMKAPGCQWLDLTEAA